MMKKDFGDCRKFIFLFVEMMIIFPKKPKCK